MLLKPIYQGHMGHHEYPHSLYTHVRGAIPELRHLFYLLACYLIFSSPRTTQYSLQVESISLSFKIISSLIIRVAPYETPQKTYHSRPLYETFFFFQDHFLVQSQGFPL